MRAAAAAAAKNSLDEEEDWGEKLEKVGEEGDDPFAVTLPPARAAAAAAMDMKSAGWGCREEDT